MRPEQVEARKRDGERIGRRRGMTIEEIEEISEEMEMGDQDD